MTGKDFNGGTGNVIDSVNPGKDKGLQKLFGKKQENIEDLSSLKHAFFNKKWILIVNDYKHVKKSVNIPM